MLVLAIWSIWVNNNWFEILLSLNLAFLGNKYKKWLKKYTGLSGYNTQDHCY